MDGQLLWVVAFLLYVYDSISVGNRCAVLRYGIEGVTAKIAVPTGTIRGRRIFVPNPLRPDQCDLPLEPNNNQELTTFDRYIIRKASSFYTVHQMVSLCALLVLFGLTPFLSTKMNMLRACLLSVGLTYWLCSFHWFEMWFNRRVLGISDKAIGSDIVHVLLCPPNAVNSARRIAALRRLRYGAKPSLRAFSRLEAEKFEEQFQSLTPQT